MRKAFTLPTIFFEPGERRRRRPLLSHVDESSSRRLRGHKSLRKRTLTVTALSTFDNHGPLGAHPRLRRQLARLVERARLLWPPRQPVRLACSRPASASRQRLWRPALCASPAHEPPGAWLAAAPRRRSDEARPYGRLHARAPPNRRRVRGVLTCRLPPTPRVALWRRRLPLATPLGPARAGCTLRPAVRFWERRPRLVAHLCWRRCRSPLSR